MISIQKAFQLVSEQIGELDLGGEDIRFRFHPQPCGTVTVQVSFRNGHRWERDHWYDVGSKAKISAWHIQAAQLATSERDEPIKAS